MLKVRVIPTLLWKEVGLVKGIAFDSWRRVGSVLPAIKVYNTRQVDELILLDITATKNGSDPDYETIADLAAECFVPLTVGGGISKITQIKELLRAGADKVAINTAAYSNPDVIRESSKMFGRQCIVASIDVRRVGEGIYKCYSHCGENETEWEPVKWAKELERLGAGEILITSVENDGTMEGYDLELIKRVTASVNIPVIASGGAGDFEDAYKALTLGKASAVAMASMFHFTEKTPLEVKQYLGERGIPVRNINIGNR